MTVSINQSPGQSLDGRRIAVIGSGMAGLTAAYKLTKFGAKVTVFEKDYAPGGRAKTVLKDGFELNLGPHALYMGGAAHKFLSEIGLTPAGSQPALGDSVAVFEGKTYSLPMSPKGLLLCSYLSAGEKLELPLVMDKISKLDLSKLMSTSFADWLTDNVKGQRVRQTIECFVRLSTYSDNPQIMSAGAGFQQLALALKGVLYLDHGWHSMIESLHSALEDRVEFHFGAAVETINASATDVTIKCNVPQPQFDAVLLCIPPDQVNGLLPGAINNASLAKIVPSKAACLDVCLRRLPRPENTFALGIDEALYYSVHSATAKLAPEGGALIHLAFYLSDKNIAVDHAQRLEELLDQLQPGWREELVYKRFLPHMVASFGTPRSVLSGAQGVELPRLANYSNVFVCGDYVGRGAQLVDAAVKSALAAVDSLAQANGKSLTAARS